MRERFQFSLTRQTPKVSIHETYGALSDAARASEHARYSYRGKQPKRCRHRRCKEQADAPCRAPPTRVACKCVTYDGTELTYAIESVYLRMVMLWSPSTPPISESAKLSAGHLNVQANFIAEWDPSLGIREAGTAEFLHFGRKSLERTPCQVAPRSPQRTCFSVLFRQDLAKF